MTGGWWPWSSLEEDALREPRYMFLLFASIVAWNPVGTCLSHSWSRFRKDVIVRFEFISIPRALWSFGRTKRSVMPDSIQKRLNKLLSYSPSHVIERERRCRSSQIYWMKNIFRSMLLLKINPTSDQTIPSSTNFWKSFKMNHINIVEFLWTVVALQLLWVKKVERKKWMHTPEQL